MTSITLGTWYVNKNQSLDLLYISGKGVIIKSPKSNFKIKGNWAPEEIAEQYDPISIIEDYCKGIRDIQTKRFIMSQLEQLTTLPTHLEDPLEPSGQSSLRPASLKEITIGPDDRSDD